MTNTNSNIFEWPIGSNIKWDADKDIGVWVDAGGRLYLAYNHEDTNVYYIEKEFEEQEFYKAKFSILNESSNDKLQNEPSSTTIEKRFKNVQHQK